MFGRYPIPRPTVPLGCRFVCSDASVRTQAPVGWKWGKMVSSLKTVKSEVEHHCTSVIRVVCDAHPKLLPPPDPPAAASGNRISRRDKRDHVRRRFLMSETDGFRQGADPVTVNTVKFVQALKRDQSVADCLAELEHNFDRIEATQATFLSFVFNSR